MKRPERVAAVGVQRSRSDGKAHTASPQQDTRHHNMGYPNGVSHIFMPVAGVGEGRRLFKAKDIRREPQQDTGTTGDISSI